MKLPFGSLILDAAARLLTPMVLLFAVYVIAHGHDSPGGGFQGGVLLATGLILVKLVRGLAIGWHVAPGVAVALACLGVALFAGIGLAALFFGGNYLDYGAPRWFPNPVTDRVLGTLGIEIGVALAVTGVLLVIFDVLAGVGGEDEVR